MLLEGHQVVEGIDIPQVAGVDQAHEHIADEGAVFGLVEERVFPVEDGLFQGLLTDIVIQGRSGDPQKQGQGLPVLEHIGDGLSQAGVRLRLILLELLGKPLFEVLHHRPAFPLMEEEPLLG